MLDQNVIKSVLSANVYCVFVGVFLYSFLNLDKSFSFKICYTIFPVNFARIVTPEKCETKVRYSSEDCSPIHDKLKPILEWIMKIFKCSTIM